MTLASGTVGVIQWQRSTTSSTAGFTNVGSPVVPTVSPTTATSTFAVNSATAGQSWYRVMLTSGVCGSTPTAAVSVTINPLSVAGTISGSTGLCAGNTGTTLTLADNTGSIAWQKSTNWTSATPTWTAVAGATASTFATGALAASTAFRVAVTSGACSVANTANHVITVSPAVVTKTISGPVGGVCQGSTASLVLALGTVGTIQWQSTTDTLNTSSWVNVGSAIAPTAATNAANTYVTSALSTKTFYRVLLTSGVCTSAYTKIYTVLVSTPTVSGTASAATNNVCGVNTGTTLTLANNNGTIQWQSSTNWTAATPTWTAITGATANTYATGALTASKAYRAVVKSGTCSSLNTDPVVITYYAAIVTKTITANATTPTGLSSTAALCTSSTAKILTLGTGYVGSIQWQTSTDGGTTWTNISGATAATYTVTGAVVGANMFRVQLSNGPCQAAQNTAAVTVWYKSCVKAEVDVDVTSTVFDAVAYPNPYDQFFTIQLSTESDDQVSIMVYDMAGKLLENVSVQPSDLESLQIGRELSTGVYNVVVTQGKDAKVVRMMKR